MADAKVYEEMIRQRHLYYDKVITDEMNHLKEYIDNLENFMDRYYKTYDNLCTKNNLDRNKIRKSDKTLEFEAKLRESCTIARNYHYELEKMKEDNLSGICIEPDLRNLYLRLNNERLPIIENGRIELFPITEHEQETGGAADVKEIQFPINSVRSQNAPTIAGVERKEPKNFEDAADIIVEEKYKNFDRKTKNKHSLGSSTNPNFKKGEGYHRNCQVCVAVFESRMRGYDIEALPFDENNKVMTKLRRNPEKAFIDRKTSLPPKLIKNQLATDYDTMKDWLKSIIKLNERYGFICRIEEKPGSGNLIDHIFIVYKTEQDELQFYDPQNGAKFESKELGMIRFRSRANKFSPIHTYPPKIFRIDNADLNIDYLNKISKKRIL